MDESTHAIISGESITAHEERGRILDKVSFGFWVYLMSDCLLFGTLFATFAVLRGNAFGGPTEQQIFSLPYVLIETLILLTSSFTSGLAMVALARKSVKGVIGWLGATWVLGASFLGMEIAEFTGLIRAGAGPSRSGFLSAYFTLVGTHGTHIAIGLLWMLVLMVYIGMRGLTDSSARKLTALALFWHFLDIVWIFIFTIVYLLGII
jgi:cytochrome o ubiquinol oxidase subunit 3